MTDNLTRSVHSILLVLIISGFVSLSSSATKAQESAKKFALKLAAGDAFTATIKQNSLITTVVDARKREIDNRLTVTFDWNTTAVATNGTVTMTQTISAIELHVLDETAAENTKLNVKTVDLNTAEKKRLTGVSASLMKQIQPLLNSAFTVTLSPRGEILDVSLPPKTLTKLRNVPSSLQLRALFTEKGLKEMYGQSAMVLPEQAIEKGNSWDISTAQNSPMGKFDRIHTFTYTGNEKPDDGANELAVFDLKTELKRIKTDNEKKQETETFTQDSVPPELVKFSGQGKIMLDPKTGLFQSSEMKNTLTSRQKYREKTIKTTVATTIEMMIEKK